MKKKLVKKSPGQTASTKEQIEAEIDRLQTELSALEQEDKRNNIPSEVLDSLKELKENFYRNSEKEFTIEIVAKITSVLDVNSWDIDHPRNSMECRIGLASIKGMTVSSRKNLERTFGEAFIEEINRCEHAKELIANKQRDYEQYWKSLRAGAKKYKIDIDVLRNMIGDIDDSYSDDYSDDPF